MQLDFRKYKEEDFSFCNSLLVSNMNPYFEAEGIDWDPKRYQKELAQGLVWIVSVGEVKLGFVHASEPNGNAYLNSIQLSASYQHKGMGTQILSWFESELKQRGKARLQLSVFKTNPAYKLYQRLGYTIEADRGNKYLMKKEL